MIDTNVFIAAVKRGWTDTTDLLLHLLSSSKYRLIANDVLLAEYRKYAERLNAMDFYEFLVRRVEVVNPKPDDVRKVLPYFPKNQVADAVHAATCLITGAVLITNDRHFERISKAGLIEVWSITAAIKRLIRR